MFQGATLEYGTYSHVKDQEAAVAVPCEPQGSQAPSSWSHLPNFIEHCDGRYWQRKGATPAYNNDGIPLLIPGGMATASFGRAPGLNASP